MENKGKQPHLQEDYLAPDPIKNFIKRTALRELVFASDWMVLNGLDDLDCMIHAQGWSDLFGSVGQMYPVAVKEFYKNLNVLYEVDDLSYGVCHSCLQPRVPIWFLALSCAQLL
ncbi:hypothetical protein Dimus_038254 [Dionaea muscipula]